MASTKGQQTQYYWYWPWFIYSLSQAPPYTTTSFRTTRAPPNSFPNGTRHSWQQNTLRSDSCTVRSALTQQPICCSHDQPSQSSYRPSQPTEVPAAIKANYNRRAHTRDTPRAPRSGDKGDCAMGPTSTFYIRPLCQDWKT